MPRKSQWMHSPLSRCRYSPDMARTHAIRLLNKLEEEEHPVLPDLGTPAGEEAPATCDQWGHLCSARPERACCGQCKTPRGELQPKENI